MRRLSLQVLFACVVMSGSLVRGEEPRSIYSDPVVDSPRSPSNNQSVYEKFVNIAPMDHGTVYRQSDLDAGNQRYNDAVKALDQAKENVSKRLAGDQRFPALQAQVQKAQRNYDDEIDDAMSVIDYYDDYQELLQPALAAQKRLVFLQQNSPDDAFDIASAQKRFDRLRAAVGEYEDGTLDNDKYVQQARRDFLAARDARDKFESDALVADTAVEDAQAAVDQDKQALDVISAQVARNHPQRPVTPDNSALASNDQNVSDDSDNAVAQDGEDGSDADQGPAYDPSADQDNADVAPQVYQPVEEMVPETSVVPEEYPDTYFAGTVVEIRDHYHHVRDRDGNDHFGRSNRFDDADRFDRPNFAGRTFEGNQGPQRAPGAIDPLMIQQAQFAQIQQQEQAQAAQQAFEMERQARFAQARQERENWIRQSQQQGDNSVAPFSPQQGQPNNSRSNGGSNHSWRGDGNSNSRQNSSH